MNTEAKEATVNCLEVLAPNYFGLNFSYRHDKFSMIKEIEILVIIKRKTWRKKLIAYYDSMAQP